MCGCQGGGGSRVSTVSRTSSTSTRPGVVYKDDGTVWELVSHAREDGTRDVRHVPGLQRAMAEFYADTKYWQGFNPVPADTPAPGPYPDATVVPAQPVAA